MKRERREVLRRRVRRPRVRVGRLPLPPHDVVDTRSARAIATASTCAECRRTCRPPALRYSREDATIASNAPPVSAGCGFFFRRARPTSLASRTLARSVSGTSRRLSRRLLSFLSRWTRTRFEELRRGVETGRVSRPEAPRAGRRRVVWTISAEPGHGFVRARRRRRGERHRDSAPVRRARGTRHDRRRRVRDGCCRPLNALDALDVRTISLLGVLRAEKGVPAVPVGAAGSVHRQLQRAPRRDPRGAGSSDRAP